MRIPNKFNGYSADGIRLYNDPVTMAMVGAAAGAALKPNDPLRGAMLGATVGFTGGTALGIGAGTTAAGTGLTASGSALGGSAATGTGTALGANAANAAKLGIETTGLSTGIGSASAGTMGGGTGLSIAPTTIGSASNVSSIANAKSAADAANAASTAPEWFGLNSMIKTPGGLSVTPATASAGSSVPGASYSLSGVPSATNYSLVAPSPVTSPPTPTFMDQLSMSGKSAYENPMMTMQALNATQGLLSPEQIASAPAVPIQARGQLKPFNPMESMDPYRQSVISNQPISLLG
jgi:hypothetical protein